MKYKDLEKYFQYCATTGQIISKVRQGRWNAGDVIDSRSWYGHVDIVCKGHSYGGHQVAWYLHYREVPEKGMCIDHINGVPWDNAISNLRLVTYSENNYNRRRVRSDAINHDLTVFPGVCYDPGSDNWIVKHGRLDSGLTPSRAMPSLLEAMCLKMRLRNGEPMPDRLRKGSAKRKYLETANA